MSDRRIETREGSPRKTETRQTTDDSHYCQKCGVHKNYCTKDH